MNTKFGLIFFILVFSSGVQSASFFETSLDYIISLGRSIAPSLFSFVDCVGGDDTWGCVQKKAGKMLDIWGDDVEKQRRSWEEEADAEIRQSGRSLNEMPSKIGKEITDTLNSLTSALEIGVARALESRKKHDSGGIDSITISAGGGDKQKMKKKKQKPPKIHLIHPMVIPMRKAQKEEKGRNFGSGVQSWVIGERALNENATGDLRETGDNAESGVEKVEDRSLNEYSSGNVNEEIGIVGEQRGVLGDMWALGKEAVDSLAEQVVENEDKENGLEDRSDLAEQRGKKKKKKKAILKLLILGAVLKAKIGTLLQILTYKLQIKFFIVACLGLGINLARLWIDLKNKHQHQPQKIIYYEHAQHQHHYDHEEEEQHGWGAPWSRSIYPEETDSEPSEVSPYKGHEASLLYSSPYLTRD